ncbi:hypothetical protein KI387_040742, partial [Taxus chinensis]
MNRGERPRAIVSCCSRFRRIDPVVDTGKTQPDDVCWLVVGGLSVPGALPPLISRWLYMGPIISFLALSQQRERSLSICLAQVEFPRRNPQPDLGEESDDSAAVRNGVSRPVDLRNLEFRRKGAIHTKRRAPLPPSPFA